jgi:hypothetical protein
MRRRITIGSGSTSIALLVALAFVRHGPSGKAGEKHILANDCCGTVELAEGTMLLNGKQRVRYTMAKDAEGAYVLPRTSVAHFSTRVSTWTAHAQYASCARQATRPDQDHSLSGADKLAGIGYIEVFGFP